MPSKKNKHPVEKTTQSPATTANTQKGESHEKVKEGVVKIEDDNNVAAEDKDSQASTEKKEKQKQLKKGETDGEGEVKNKAQLRAERRAVQEAQRAAKANKQPSTGQQQQAKPHQQVKPQQPAKSPQRQGKSPHQQAKSPHQQAKSPQRQAKSPHQQGKSPRRDARSAEARQARQARPKIPRLPVAEQQRPVTQKPKKAPMFKHLPQFEKPDSLSDELGHETKVAHPSIATLGLKFANELITEPWEKERSLVIALKEFLLDYKVPMNKDFMRDFLDSLQYQTDYLHRCKPLSMDSENILKHFKYHIKLIPPHFTEKQCLDYLDGTLETFFKNNLTLAQERISSEFINLLKDDEVIMVFDYSKLVLKALFQAKDSGKKFSVVVIDNVPKFRAKKMLESLNLMKIKCLYGFVHQIPFYMPRVTLAVLGAEAIFLNGSVLCMSGGSLVMLNAKNLNKPTLILCETYKFSDKKPFNALTYNELDDTDKLVNLNRCGRKSPADSWEVNPYLYVANLTYSIIPSELVTAIVTEVGPLSPAAVDAILKSKWVSTSS